MQKLIRLCQQFRILIKQETEKREKYLMGRCIGCGRCDFGECPVKVKRKSKV